MATISKVKLNQPVGQSFRYTTKTKDQTQRENEIAGLAQNALASGDRTNSSVQKAQLTSKNSVTQTNFLSQINIPTIVDPNEHKWDKFYDCIGWCLGFLGILLGIGAPFAFLALAYFISPWFLIGALITAPVAGLLSLCLREVNIPDPKRESPIYSQNSRGEDANFYVGMLADFITKPLSEFSDSSISGKIHYIKNFCKFFKIDEQTEKTVTRLLEECKSKRWRLFHEKYDCRRLEEDEAKAIKAGLNSELPKISKAIAEKKILIKEIEERLKELDREFEAFRSTPHKTTDKSLKALN